MEYVCPFNRIIGAQLSSELSALPAWGRRVQSTRDTISAEHGVVNCRETNSTFTQSTLLWLLIRHSLGAMRRRMSQQLILSSKRLAAPRMRAAKRFDTRMYTHLDSGETAGR